MRVISPSGATGGHLASSSSFRSLSARRSELQLSSGIESGKQRGWRGGLITPHRAFARLHVGTKDVVACACLTVILSLCWIRILPWVGGLWGRVFVYWTKALQLEGSVVMAPQQWGARIHFALPYLNASAGPPDPHTWWITAVVTLLVFATTYFMSEEMVPWIYLLRFLVFLQGTSLVYFVFAAARFPHDLTSYTLSMLFFGTILIGLLPLILGFTYYLLDFSLLKRLALTAISAGYLIAFVPLQYMLHIYILRKSILFMPLLYFAFGPSLDVLIFVSLYSWGMSWKSKNRLVA